MVPVRPKRCAEHVLPLLRLRAGDDEAVVVVAAQGAGASDEAEEGQQPQGQHRAAVPGDGAAQAEQEHAHGDSRRPRGAPCDPLPEIHALHSDTGATRPDSPRGGRRPRRAVSGEWPRTSGGRPRAGRGGGRGRWCCGRSRPAAHRRPAATSGCGQRGVLQLAGVVAGGCLELLDRRPRPPRMGGGPLVDEVGDVAVALGHRHELVPDARAPTSVCDTPPLLGSTRARPRRVGLPGRTVPEAPLVSVARVAQRRPGRRRARGRSRAACRSGACRRRRASPRGPSRAAPQLTCVRRVGVAG